MLLGPTEISQGGMWGYGAVNGYPVSGSVSSPFGERAPILTPNGWTSDFHSGIDIPAPLGTPIFCPAPGEVCASYNDGAGGQTVVVRFDDGTGAMFIHMQGIQLAQGTKVRRGDIIGTIGSTGLSTGPHLHFSLLKAVGDGPIWYDKSVFIDPMRADWTATVPNSEFFVPPEVMGAREYALQIRSYVDAGVPLPAFATMMDTLIAMIRE